MRGGIRSIGAAWLALASVICVAPSSAKAQTTKNVQTVFTNRASFSLPVRMDDKDRAELKELRFFVKSPAGPKAGQWVCLETAPPTKNRFTYQAAFDGEYWFAFVTVDKAGQVAPPSLEKAAPGLIVVVDTHAPEVDVQKLPVASGETFLQCQIKDANPDYASMRLEYQTPEKGWRALEPQTDAPGVFRVTDSNVLRGTVRATVADKAGNRLVREINLSRESTATTVAARTSTNAVEGPILSTSVMSAQPLTQKVDRAVAEESTPAPRQLLSSLHCRMEYTLDTPNVSRVEGFATRDGGKTWMKLGEDADRKSPFEFDLPEDGVYGVVLVISTGGRTEAGPSAGDTPDWWVEVDTTRPVVVVNEVRRGTGDESGVIHFNWSAKDKNLGSEPVELLWASQPEGPWQTAMRGLKAEGSTRWALPHDGVNRVYLRVEATDKAGNVGRWEMREPIEISKAKAKVLGVTAGRDK